MGTRLGISGALKCGEPPTWCSKWDPETSSHPLGAHGLLPNPLPAGLGRLLGLLKAGNQGAQAAPGVKSLLDQEKLISARAEQLGGGLRSRQQHKHPQPCPNALGTSAP